MVLVESFPLMLRHFRDSSSVNLHVEDSEDTGYVVNLMTAPAAQRRAKPRRQWPAPQSKSATALCLVGDRQRFHKSRMLYP